jgi:hypothetical protein
MCDYFLPHSSKAIAFAFELCILPRPPKAPRRNGTGNIAKPQQTLTSIQIAMQLLVVGAGVVGLAIARAAAMAGHEVIVAEKAAAIGTGTSSRNSEVIHAGLYYPLASDALRLLRLAWRAASQMRQARRRHQRP